VEIVFYWLGQLVLLIGRLLAPLLFRHLMAAFVRA
jgi:hypothetical protein